MVREITCLNKLELLERMRIFLLRLLVCWKSLIAGRVWCVARREKHLERYKIAVGSSFQYQIMRSNSRVVLRPTGCSYVYLTYTCMLGVGGTGMLIDAATRT